MKKSMFLTMMFGLMIALTGSASAQGKFSGRVALDGNGNFTPQVGDVVIRQVHIRQNNEPDAPSGTRYLFLTIRRGNDAKNYVILKVAADQNWLQQQDPAKYREEWKITKVDNGFVIPRPGPKTGNVTYEFTPTVWNLTIDGKTMNIRSAK